VWGCGLNFYVLAVVLNCGYDAMHSHKHTSGAYCFHLCCCSEKTKCFWMLVTVCQATWWHDREDPDMKLCTVKTSGHNVLQGGILQWAVVNVTGCHWKSLCFTLVIGTSVIKTECCLRAAMFRYASIVTARVIAKDIFLNIICMFYTLFKWIIYKNFFFPWCNNPTQSYAASLLMS